MAADMKISGPEGSSGFTSNSSFSGIKGMGALNFEENPLENAAEQKLRDKIQEIVTRKLGDLSKDYFFKCSHSYPGKNIQEALSQIEGGESIVLENTGAGAFGAQIASVGKKRKWVVKGASLPKTIFTDPEHFDLFRQALSQQSPTKEESSSEKGDLEGQIHSFLKDPKGRLFNLDAGLASGPHREQLAFLLFEIIFPNIHQCPETRTVWTEKGVYSIQKYVPANSIAKAGFTGESLGPCKVDLGSAQRMGVIDLLIGNQDRNSHNGLVAPAASPLNAQDCKETGRSEVRNNNPSSNCFLTCRGRSGKKSEGPLMLYPIDHAQTFMLKPKEGLNALTRKKISFLKRFPRLMKMQLVTSVRERLEAMDPEAILEKIRENGLKTDCDNRIVETVFRENVRLMKELLERGPISLGGLYAAFRARKEESASLKK